MEIPDDLLAEFIPDEGTDFWDMAIVAGYLQSETEQRTFQRSFSLTNYTAEDSLNFFRFSPPEIHWLSQCLRIPATVTAANRNCAPGIEALCIVLKRLAYPCRYADLEHFFDRTRLELCFLFNTAIDYIDECFRGHLTNPDQPWLSLPKLMEYAAAVQAKG